MLSLLLAIAACGNSATCESTCCDSPAGMEAPGCAPGRSYQTCGSLGSTVIELRVPGQAACSFDTINICSDPAKSCLCRRNTFCGVQCSMLACPGH